MFSIKTIYIYLIAFVAALMILWGSVSIFTSIGNFIYPKVDVLTYVEFFSNAKLKKAYYLVYEGTDFNNKLYEKYVEETVKPYKEQALNELIKSIGWTVIPLMFFTYFQIQINRLKKYKIGD